MKRIKLLSVYEAWEYVMDHYYPFGLEEFAKRTDTYAMISIQDTHTGGFGFEFVPNNFCEGVLTLYFDDTVKEVEGAVLFDEEMADRIIRFVLEQDRAETLVIHCYGGQSRSRAVAAFIAYMLGKDNSRYFAKGNPNEHVYNTLLKVWHEKYAAPVQK